MEAPKTRRELLEEAQENDKGKLQAFSHLKDEKSLAFLLLNAIKCDLELLQGYPWQDR